MGRQHQGREKAARCLSLVLEGKVSLDHFLQEYAGAQDQQVRAVLEEVQSLGERTDRYASPPSLDEKGRGRLEQLIAALRKD